MTHAPHTQIDPATFAADPYPMLAQMRRDAPITYVPQLGATLVTRRDDIHVQEKRIEVFASSQAGGLMEQIMGRNMMRKDGADHMAERKALFPAVSPKTVMRHWSVAFERIVAERIAALKAQGSCDLVTEFAMPVSGAALCAMTGLTNITPQDMDRASQEMLDAVANYIGDPEVEARGNAASDRVDIAIDERLKNLRQAPDMSILSVLDQSGMSRASIGANVKVIIGGGQNEPRDAIAGLLYALLAFPGERARITQGQATYLDAFSEYTRWIAPIQMAPRMIAQSDQVNGIQFDVGDRVFLMFGSACRDEDHFETPERFDLCRNTSAAIPFGAGPHFCAGAAAARTLVAQYAVPMLLNALPGLQLDGPVPFHGWAFRGPTSVPVRW